MIRGVLMGLIAVILWTAAVEAVEGPGTTGAGYLNYQIGAKSIAMGEALFIAGAAKSMRSMGCRLRSNQANSWGTSGRTARVNRPR